MNVSADHMPVEDLYQEVILDHNRKPRNFGSPKDGYYSVRAYNPLCGDDYLLHLNIENDVVAHILFEGHGCAISKSSASMMTVKIKKKAKQDIMRLKNQFIHMVTQGAFEKGSEDNLGNLIVFKGVSQFPIRVKCATMIWHALEEALLSRKGD